MSKKENATLQKKSRVINKILLSASVIALGISVPSFTSYAASCTGTQSRTIECKNHLGVTISEALCGDARVAGKPTPTTKTCSYYCPPPPTTTTIIGSTFDPQTCDPSKEICNIFNERVLGNYQAMFGRDPDAEGALYWTNEIHRLNESGMTTAEAEAEIDKRMLNSGIGNGETIISTEGGYSSEPPSDSMYNDFILGSYQSMFGRNAEASGALYWSNEMHDLIREGSSRGMSKAQQTAYAQQKVQERMLAAGIKNGESINSTTGSSTLSAGYVPPVNVDALSGNILTFYQNTLGRMADGQGALYWTSRVQQETAAANASGASSNAAAQQQAAATVRTQMVHSAIKNGENINENVVSSGVLSIYNEVLGRTADGGGAMYWTQQQQQLKNSGLSGDALNSKLKEMIINGGVANGELNSDGSTR